MMHAAGPYGLMTVAALILICCAALTWWIDRRHVRDSGQRVQKDAEQPLRKDGGFQLIFRDRYLLLIAALVVLLNVVNSSGEFLLGKLVVTEAARAFPDAIAMAADRQKFIGEFYGSFFSWVNVTGLVLQMFFVSRVFKAFGPGGALFIGPSIALVGYSVILVAAVLGLVQVLKSWITARTIPSKVLRGKPYSFLPAVKPSTRRKRRLIPSSCVSVTYSRPASSTLAPRSVSCCRHSPL